MKKLFAVSVLTFLLTACATGYPLNMSEEQWKSLTPDERKALLLKQQKYQEEQRLARIQAAARERELELQRDIAEKQRLQKLYDHPYNGNVLTINILGGEYSYSKTHKRILEETYQIALGETKKIEVPVQNKKHRYSDTETFYLQYNLSGTGVYLYLDHPNSYNSQRIALLQNGEWACGTNYTKSLTSSYKNLSNVHFYVKQVGGQCGHRKRYY